MEAIESVSEILKSLSHPALIQATEMTYQMAINYQGRILAATFYREPEAAWFVTDPIGLNRVVGTLFTIDTPRSIIDRTLKQIATSVAGGPMSWDVGPSLRNTSLEECLHANGWSKDEEVQSMVLDLHTVKMPAKSPDGLTIKQVEDEETFKQHIDTMIAGFEFPEPMAHYASGLDFGDKFLHDPATYYYVGYVQGKPVTISLVLLYAGIAGIYNIATIPQMRRQGLATAMTLAALRQARDLGYHIAVLQASEMGVHVYRRLGFQDHFTFDSYNLHRSAEQ
jgi:ribosomal protein S18 acetylase RimI-like enzyme